MRLVGLLILGVVLGVAATWGYHVLYSPVSSAGENPSGASAAAGNDQFDGAAKKRLIFARGTLEPRGGVILVGSPLAGIRVQKVMVRDGDSVEAGYPLAELDTTAIEAELRLAEAQLKQAADRQKGEIESAEQRLAVARLAVSQAEKSRTLEMDVLEKQLAAAEKKVKQAEDDLDRVKTTKPPPGAPSNESQIEHQQGLVDLTSAERDAARAAVRRLDQSLAFALDKAKAEERAANQAVVIATRSPATEPFDRQIKLAQQKLTQTKILAPSAGTVISVMTHPGELVGGQPLVQLADLSSLVCLAEVDVADVFSVKEHQEAWITCRALPAAKIRGRVERVRNRAAPATLRPIDPRQPVDRTVATVVLSVDAGEVTRQLQSSAVGAAGALVGLQVDVEIPL